VKPITPEDMLVGLTGKRRAEVLAEMQRQGVTVSEAYCPPDASKREAGDRRCEARLLGEVGGYLTQRGYVYLTGANAVEQPSARGYWLHLNAARRNPMLLDVLVLHPSGRYLMVELKVRDEWQTGQKELIAQGYGTSAWSIGEFAAKLKMWEEAHRCKTCKHWKPCNDPHEPHMGKCDCDRWQYEALDIQDGVSFSDCEGFPVSFETGEGFGCVHHEANREGQS
jgi:hypothetical protein